MDTQDALFEDIQAISDDAEALGLRDVALVLEFALDVFLRETQTQGAVTDTQTLDFEPVREQVKPDVATPPNLTTPSNDEIHLGWSMSTFPLMRA